MSAGFSELDIKDWSLKQDETIIFQSLPRLIRGLVAFVSSTSLFRQTSEAICLGQCAAQKMWLDSSHLTRQVEKIGKTFSMNLAVNQVMTLEDLEKTSPKKIERVKNAHNFLHSKTLSPTHSPFHKIVGRNPPFGENVLEALAKIWPKFAIAILPSTTLSSSLSSGIQNRGVDIEIRCLRPISNKAGDGSFSTVLLGDLDRNELISYRSLVQ